MYGQRKLPKVVLAGDTLVGKTALFQRILRNEFSDGAAATIGCAQGEKTVDVAGKEVAFTLVDTAGQEKYRSLSPIFFQDSAAVIFCFDLTRAATLQGVNIFLEIARNVIHPNCSIVLVGTKSDLDNDREVSRAEAGECMKQIGADFYLETSAKTGAGLDDLVVGVAQAIGDMPQATDVPLPNDDPRGCC
jgi:small GTP-binding protein